MTLARSDELIEFKTRINLVDYAATCGYEVDRAKSGRQSTVMKHPDGDKVVISRQGDGHWVYFSVRDSRDQGTVIDFVQRRTKDSLGAVRLRLRTWLSLPSPDPGERPQRSREIPRALNELTLPEVRSARVREALRTMRRVDDGKHRYLNEARGLSVELLGSSRFKGTLREDGRGNAVFPHYATCWPDEESWCGYEVKNVGHTRFATGGRKGLWLSNQRADDERLVLAESAIDAISFGGLAGDERTRFASVSGGFGAHQEALLYEAARTLPEGAVVVLAFDNDEGGDGLVNRVQAILKPFDVREYRPPERGKDWNDVIRGPL